MEVYDSNHRHPIVVVSLPHSTKRNENWGERQGAQEWRNRTPNAHEPIFQGIVSMFIVLTIP